MGQCSRFSLPLSLLSSPWCKEPARSHQQRSKGTAVRVSCPGLGRPGQGPGQGCVQESLSRWSVAAQSPPPRPLVGSFRFASLDLQPVARCLLLAAVDSGLWWLVSVFFRSHSRISFSPLFCSPSPPKGTYSRSSFLPSLLPPIVGRYSDLPRPVTSADFPLSTILSLPASGLVTLFQEPRGLCEWINGSDRPLKLTPKSFFTQHNKPQTKISTD